MNLFNRTRAAVCLLGMMNLAVQPVLAADKPNIIVILSDDMGFSDIGSYGGEIPTPNLDRLAGTGVRFTQFYNMARCCPSRAALLTGLYPHQAGIGHMMEDRGLPGYRGNLSTDSVTMAEVLKEAGYRTYMTGKWHVAHPSGPKSPKHNWPMQRGFEKYYGIITGASNYYDPATLCRGNKFITVENDPEYKPENYYFTDALTDNSIKFLKEHEQESPDKPFFMYVAYTAAHWPLHAPEDEIARQKGKYDAGYDAIRKARFEKMKELGLIDKELQWSPTVGDWSGVENKPWEARTMETYAAMVARMDTGIGRIVETLRDEGKLDNTIIMFMQDNGGCAETIGRENRDDYATNLKPMGPDELQTKIWPPMQTRDGRPVRTGTDVMAGAADTYNSYGENWANVSDTPFRFYKHWVHEGGISTPLIVHWPAGIAESLKNKFVREPGHLIDIMATVVDAADTSYPATFNGNKIAPMAGKSLLPLVKGEEFDRGGPIFWEHESNRAVRDGKWKIVTEGMGAWELYNMEVDRAEMNNLAEEHPDIVKKMAAQWDEWAKKNDVLPLGAWEKPPVSVDHEEDRVTTQTVFRLKSGDALEGMDRPPLAQRELRIVAKIAEWGDQGVIVSQGGSRFGYALYSKDGKPGFVIRDKGESYSIESTEVIQKGEEVRLVATLALDGVMTFKAGKQKGQISNTAGSITETPGEGVTVGNDPAGQVGDYGADWGFNGQVQNVVIRVSERGKAFHKEAKPKEGKKAKPKTGRRNQ